MYQSFLDIALRSSTVHRSNLISLSNVGLQSLDPLLAGDLVPPNLAKVSPGVIVHVFRAVGQPIELLQGHGHRHVGGRRLLQHRATEHVAHLKISIIDETSES